MSLKQKGRKYTGEASCPFRAVVRSILRHKLQENGHKDLADALFERSAIEDGNVVAQYPAMAAFRNTLLQVQQEREEEFLQLVVALRSYQGTVDGAFEVYKHIAQSLLSPTQSNMGRVGALIAFSGFTIAELADKGGEFIRTVARKVEDDINGRVQEFLPPDNIATEAFVREKEGKVFDWKKSTLHALGGVVAFAGSAIVLASVLARS